MAVSGSAKALHVVAAAIIDGARVLVAKRLPGGHHGGLWEFPGGKVEEGESPREALARELFEELDVVAKVGERLVAVPWDYPHRSILLDVYFCELTGGEPSPRECAELAWVTPAELSSLPMPEADVPVVSEIRKFMEGDRLIR